MIYTRVRFGGRCTPDFLTAKHADLLWEMISLPPSELSFLPDCVVYTVPAVMIHTPTTMTEFSVVSDFKGSSSQLVAKRPTETKVVYVISNAFDPHEFDRVTIYHEELNKDKYLLYPDAVHSGCSILTERVQAHQIGWGKEVVFSYYKRWVCPLIDDSKEVSDLYFKHSVPEIEMTVRGHLNHRIVLNILAANLPRCYGTLIQKQHTS